MNQSNLSEVVRAMGAVRHGSLKQNIKTGIGETIGHAVVIAIVVLIMLWIGRCLPRWASITSWMIFAAVELRCLFGLIRTWVLAIRHPQTSWVCWSVSTW